MGRWCSALPPLMENAFGGVALRDPGRATTMDLRPTPAWCPVRPRRWRTPKSSVLGPGGSRPSRGQGRGRMGPMDRRLRRAPDAEWVLMYRLGLSRKRIAELVRVHPAVVGYHLVIARRHDPGLEAEHHAAAGAAPVPYPSPCSGPWPTAHASEMTTSEARGVLYWTSPFVLDRKFDHGLIQRNPQPFTVNPAAEAGIWIMTWGDPDCP